MKSSTSEGMLSKTIIVMIILLLCLFAPIIASISINPQAVSSDDSKTDNESQPILNPDIPEPFLEVNGSDKSISVNTNVSLQPSSQEMTLDASNYVILKNDNGFDTIQMDGFSIASYHGYYLFWNLFYDRHRGSRLHP
jgi:hypothetical protein